MMHMRTSHLAAIALSGLLPLGCTSGAKDTRAEVHDRADVFVLESGPHTDGPRLRSVRIDEDGLHDQDLMQVLPQRVRMSRIPQDALRWQVRGGGPMLRQPPGPMLGVMIEQTPDGLLVKEVEDDSLAQAAGVQPGDVLLRIGDRKVHDVADVRAALAATPPGHEALIAVVRPDQGIVELKAPMPEPQEAHAGPLVDGSRGGFLGVELDDWAADGPSPRTDGPDTRTDGGAGADGAEDEAAPEDEPGRREGPGVWIAGVVPDSAAWFAGLERGDRLLAVDGEEVADGAALVGLMASRKPGTLVELRVLRDEAEQTFRVRLGARLPAMPLSHLEQPGMEWFGLPNDDLHRRFNLRMGPGRNFLFGPGDDFDIDEDLHFGDALDIEDLLHDLPGGPHADARSVRVVIEDDRMTIDQDGVTTHYTRNDEGDWVPETDDTPRPR